MSETTKLMGVIQRLEEAKLEELKDVVKKLRGFAIELKNYASNDPRSFRIETISGPCPVPPHLASASHIIFQRPAPSGLALIFGAS
jgi:hypothetical protein